MLSANRSSAVARSRLPIFARMFLRYRRNWVRMSRVNTLGRRSGKNATRSRRELRAKVDSPTMSRSTASTTMRTSSCSSTSRKRWTGWPSPAPSSLTVIVMTASSSSAGSSAFSSSNELTLWIVHSPCNPRESHGTIPAVRSSSPITTTSSGRESTSELPCSEGGITPRYVMKASPWRPRSEADRR